MKKIWLFLRAVFETKFFKVIAFIILVYFTGKIILFCFSGQESMPDSFNIVHCFVLMVLGAVFWLISFLLYIFISEYCGIVWKNYKRLLKEDLEKTKERKSA